jgi:hypothetical protein
VSDGFVFLGDETIDAFMADHESHVKFLGGPVGTGKSVGCLFEVARFCLRAVPENDDGTPAKAKALVIRQDQSKIKSTVLQTFRSLFGKVSDDLTKMAYPIVVEDLPFKGEIDGVERTVLITWVFLGVASLDEANTKLKSFEATCAYINETQTYEGTWIVNNTFERLGRYPMPKRDENGDILATGYQGQRMIVADFNPPADDHWLYKADKEDAKPATWRFYKYPPPLLYIKDVDGNIVDFEPNPEAKDYAKKQSSGYNYWLDQARALVRQPGGLRKIRIDIQGEYGNSYAGKPVYEEWDDDLHIAKTKLVANKSKPFYVGFDHSGVNPAMVIAQMGDGGLAIIHELYAGEMTVEDFLDEVFVPLLNEYGYDRKNMTIILDPHDARDRSGQTTKRMLLKKQFRAVHSNTNDPVKRQGAVKHYLTRRLMKVDKSCKMLIEGFRGKYNREKIRGTEHYKAVPDANKNEWSHVNDSCQYLVSFLKYGAGLDRDVATNRQIQEGRSRGFGGVVM